MRRNWRAAFPIAAIVAIVACAPKMEWRDYAYPQKGFTASFPIAPKVTDKQGEAWHTDAIVLKDIYTVSVSCDPTTDETADDILNAGIGLWSDQGNITSQTDISSGHTAGKELLVARQGAPSAKVRVFAHRQCLYQVSAVVTKGPQDLAVSRFLDSFRLTN
jgi:hypothetical protein